MDTPSVQDISNAYIQISTKAVQNAIKSSKHTSTMGHNQVSYQMVAANTWVRPELLPNLFSHLISYGLLLTAWKMAKCLLIVKPGCTDTLIPKNLLPI